MKHREIHFELERTRLPTHIRVDGVVTGAAHWAYAGLPAIVDDFGSILLINPSNGEVQR